MFDETTLILIALIMAFGGTVKGTLGLGMPLVSIGLLSTFLPATEVLGLVILPILFTNLFQVYEAGGGRQVIRDWWPMIVCLWGGLVVGGSILVVLDPSLLYAMIGSLLIVFCVLSLARSEMHIPEQLVFRSSLLVGGVAGIIGGISAIWGPPVSMFLLATGIKKEEFVRTVGVMWSAGAIPLTVFYVAIGLLGQHNFHYSLAACIPALIGLWIGQRIRKRLPQEAFRKTLLMVLLVIGANLIRRSFIS